MLLLLLLLSSFLLYYNIMMIFARQNIVRENSSAESYYVLFMSVDILMAYILLYRIFSYYYCFLLRAKKPTSRRWSQIYM